MNKTKCFIAALGVAAAGFALPASAQMSMPTLSSAYIGGAFGKSDLDLSCEDTISCDNKDSAWRVFGGFQVSRHFSVELGYANLGEATFDFGAGDTASVEFSAWDLSAIGAFPIGPVSIFGRLGLFRASVEAREPLFGIDEEDTDTGLTYGVGVQYDVNKNLGVRAEWQRYNGVKVFGSDEKFDPSVINIAVLWRFQ
jgi:OmpA-OmpF porin, OOP family